MTRGMSFVGERRESIDLRVQLAAERIGAISRQATLEFALEVGRVVITTLYEGDLHEWRRRGRKASSLRALARHPELCISPATLYRSLALYELSTRVRPVASWKFLGISHMRAVLSAPVETQQVILERAENEAWSVARVEREVAELCGSKEPQRGGRPRSPEYVKSIQKIGRLTDPDALEGFDDAERLETSQVHKLYALVAQARERLHLVEHELARLLRESRRVGTPKLERLARQ